MTDFDWRQDAAANYDEACMLASDGHAGLRNALTNGPLQAPFPYFGGKSRVADVVWEAFGNVPNYVEPFFGSGAMLLARPHLPKIETVNDADGMLANFWRSVKLAPDETAEHADWPVNENDLNARHAWLVGQRDNLTSKLEGNPDFYDARIAGWWVWGACSWIAGGWCSGNGPWRSVDGVLVKGGVGGIKRQLPHLGGAGQGINRQQSNVTTWFTALSDRLRRVRVCCGDWSRVCGPTPTYHNGITGVFLDPPYSTEADRSMRCYSTDSGTVAHDVRKWCIKNGSKKLMRIALCGYDGEHNELVDYGWRVHAWKARGGYGSQSDDGRGRDNASRERIWLSPHCLSEKQGSLF